MTLQIYSTSVLLLVLLGLSALVGKPVFAHDLGHHTANKDVSTDIASLAQLTDRIDQYRKRGDDKILLAVGRYFEKEGAPDNPQARMLYAWYLQALHRFEEARDALAPLYKRSNAPMEVALLQANLSRVVGDMKTARAACRSVLDQQPVVGQLCLAQVALMAGEQPTVVSLERLRAMVPYLPEGIPYRAWAHATLADLASAAGQQRVAIEQSRYAYRMEPTVQNQVALAKHYVRTDQIEEALLVLAEGVPHAPAVVIARLVAHLEQGTLASQSRLIHRVHHEFEELIEHGDFLHAREMTAFYLDVLPKPGLARRLAIKNWEVQKELEDRELLNRALSL